MGLLRRASAIRLNSADLALEKNKKYRKSGWRFIVALAFLLSACAPASGSVDQSAGPVTTLPALAARFNTTEKEIRAANSVLPEHVTTLPAGLPLKIPIYYEPFWGSSFEILPDSLFVNGPAQVGFDVVEYVKEQPGWLKNASQFLGDEQRRGGEIIDYIATTYSVSPRLLLALIEFQAGGLTQAEVPDGASTYPLGYIDGLHIGLARQLNWAANELNNGYYAWRTGKLDSFELQDGRLQRVDPWQNAASAALQYYFSQVMTADKYELAISGEGLLKTYTQLFGDPWSNVQELIPGSLEQPYFRFPFQTGTTWAFTGGPHTGWGEGDPLAAIDFAPGNIASGCTPTDVPAAAVADGVVVRTGDALVVLDLDGDGDERTGWTIFYLHISNASLPPVGRKLKAGDPVGLPSCEGGEATGTHVHIARRYNGEWIPAGGALAFNLEGWVVQAGSVAYQGTLIRDGKVITACTCSDETSHIFSNPQGP
ncbi:membrane proteins related to metalloendopeptidases [Longilinea arvoryzae]|uniref:Membrane proteins related to metalloendopeptidases n=1 Tax=Longilinea arvoryzae TaxID=360412 RepID=A0A0S7BIW9_9CHLR|nr:membrane proteins related to metalloendopeptidases [Longilinea arvoryzae]